MCDDEPIAGAGPTAAKVFDALAACGYDRLTIARGVTPEEIDGLVSALSGAGREPAGEASPRLTSTAHLTVSVLDMGAAPAAAAKPESPRSDDESSSD